MEKRIELGYLLDFYGPLLTEHRREILNAYCVEDMSLQEIAEQLGITRQGVYDALGKGEKQLAGYEAKLGLVKRALATDREAERCLALLDDVERALDPDGDAQKSLAQARAALQRILQTER